MSLWRIADISTVLHLHSHFIVFLSNQQHEMASWCQQGFLMSRDDFLNMSLDLDLDFSVQAAHRPLSSSHGAD